MSDSYSSCSSSSYLTCNNEEEFQWADSSSDNENSSDEGPTWEETVPSSIKQISYDQATHDAWQSAVQEISFARAGVMRQLHLNDFDDFELVDFLQYIVDKLWMIIDSILNNRDCFYTFDRPLTKVMFEKILMTFFVSSSFSSSITDIYENEFIIKTDFCSKSEYITFWKAVADHDSNMYDESRFFWQILCDEINKLCRDLFLMNWPFFASKLITIDDDKDHSNGRMKHLENSGLKGSQFVRDNRRGFTCHTLVFTATGLPLGIVPEIISDNGSFDTSSRIILSQRAPAHRGNSLPTLNNVTIFFADRQYWTDEFMTFILRCGITIGSSTHKRTHRFPFTFDQKLTKNDTRVLISMKGGKSTCLKHRVLHGSALTAIAYRDGHSKVVLGMSSCSQVKHCDIQLTSHTDREKMPDETQWCRLNTWKFNLNSNDGLSDRFVDLFLDCCAVDPVTSSGSEDHSWFIGRAFSFTSLTSDGIFFIIYDHLKYGTISSAEENIGSLMNKLLPYLGEKYTISYRG